MGCPRNAPGLVWEALQPPAGAENRSVLKRVGHTATATDDQYIYIIGGRTCSKRFANDMLRYDTKKKGWDLGWPNGPFEGRSYHTATLVGRKLWIVGGANGTGVFPDAHVFDLDTLQWQSAQLRGDVELLARTAHGAVLHPVLPDTILIFGGYRAQCTPPIWADDLVLLDTVRREVRLVTSVGGNAPRGRAYHTFTALGTCCYAIGGRGSESELVRGEELVRVYDAAQHCWMPPGEIGGRPPPQPRSSHDAAAIGDRMIVYGGALGSKQRSPSMLSLVVGAGERLSWADCEDALCTPPRPAGRAGHAMAVVGSTLYAFGGYTEAVKAVRGRPAAPEAPDLKDITGEAWAISLPATSADAQQLRVAALQQQNTLEAVRARPQASVWRQPARVRSASQADGSQSPASASLPPTGAGVTLADARARGLAPAAPSVGTLPADPGWQRSSGRAGAGERVAPRGPLDLNPPPPSPSPADSGPLAKVQRIVTDSMQLGLLAGSLPVASPARGPAVRSFSANDVEVHALQAQLQRVREEVGQARSQAEEARRLAEEQSGKARTAAAALQTAEGRLAAASRETEGLRQEVQQQREQNLRLTDNHKRDLALLDQNQLELQELRSENSKLRREALDRREDSQRKESDMRREVENLVKTLEKQEEAHAAVAGRLQAKEKELAEERKALAEARSEAAEERDSRAREKAEAHTRTRDMSQQLAAAQQHAAAAEAASRQQEAELGEARAKLQATEERAQKVDADMKLASLELTQLKTTNFTLQGHNRDMAAAMEQVQHHLEASSRLLPAHIARSKELDRTYLAPP